MAILAGVVIFLWQLSQWGREAPFSEAIDAKPLSFTTAEKRPLSPVATYSVMEERTLFSASRRPRPPAVPPTPVPLSVPTFPPLLVPTLVGTIVSPERRAAIFHLEAKPDYTAAEGGSVSGWTLAQVLPGRILLRAGPREVELKVLISQGTPQSQSAPLLADTSMNFLHGRR